MIQMVKKTGLGKGLDALFSMPVEEEEIKKEREYINFSKEGRKVMLGWLSLIIALVHFVFPSFVLL